MKKESLKAMNRSWISMVTAGSIAITTVAAGLPLAAQAKSTPPSPSQEPIDSQIGHTPVQENMSKSQLRQAAKQEKYSISHLKTLDNSELVELLKEISWTQIPELFTYNDDTQEFYEDRERVQAIIDALQESGKNFTKDDEQGIHTYVEVLRSGYYLGYYHDELKYLMEPKYKQKIIPALQAITTNQNFALGTKTQNEIISSTGKLISNTTVDSETIDLLSKVMEDFNDNRDKWSDDREASEAFYSVLQGVGYVLIWGADDSEKDELKGSIDAFLDPIFDMAENGETSADHVWLTNNALYYTGKLGSYYSDPDKANDILTKAMKTYKKWSEPYFTAAQQITEAYGEDANGKKIDLDEMVKEGKKHYLPQQFTFDDGAFVFKTGDKLTEEQVERLYWASKEVKAQFHRVIGNDKELESGNPDDVLTIVIYNTPDEYKMNRFLYGYDTDNGGIYIEGTGTFFTYDRTKEQSIYSLEELFRHEFVHYLQGRYEVPGMWGQGKIYENSRLPWYEEGGAEFFAGATRTEGIKPRQSVVGNIRNAAPYLDYTAADMMRAKYGTLAFYDYSFALQYHLFKNDFARLDKINDTIRSNDVAAYDDMIEEFSRDRALERGYQETLEDLIDQYEELDVPLVSDDYLQKVDVTSKEEVYRKITEVASLTNVTTDEKDSGDFRSFTLRGVYTGGASQGEYQDWREMNRSTDGFLKELSTLSWNGYDTVTSYFTNYRTTKDGRFAYDVVFHGKLAQEDGSETEQPNPNPNPEESSISLGKPITGIIHPQKTSQEFRLDVKSAQQLQVEMETKQGDGVAWLVFHESDRENYISYPTKREGNKLIGSFDAKPGTYYVTAYTYRTGQEDQPFTLLVTGEDSPREQLYQESENNDSTEQANGPLPIGTTVSGDMKGNDWQDIFAFQVDKPEEIRISLTPQEGQGVTWMLFHEANLDQPVTYPQELEGNLQSAHYQVKPGRYFLHVYKYQNEDIVYTVETKQR
ncbi:collagenase [Brevibacillus formosus]|nr:collagenase [Brevibacillus formosus]